MKEKSKKRVDRLKVMIATPTRSGSVNSKYVESLVTVIGQSWVSSSMDLEGGCRVTWAVASGVSNIVAGRNKLANDFLRSDNDVLLWVDDDTTWVPTHFDAMVEAIDRGEWAGCIPQIKLIPVNDLLSGKLETTSGGFYIEGRLYCRQTGFGFAFFHRKVFEKMVKEQRVPLMKDKGGDFYGFHNPIIKERQLLSEDLSFCDRVDQSGFRIAVVGEDGVGHKNVVEYPGIPVDYIRKTVEAKGVSSDK